MNSYLFDTYAIIEIIKGNLNYKIYLDEEIIINNFIFAELCYILLREKYPNANIYLDKHSKFIVSVKPALIKEAMLFRFENKSKNLSITDCISYFMAKELGIKFLTGDKEFEKLENVEFVK